MVSDDRGQLILVGAVAIALVLLGLVLIVNTALFTQVVGSEGTVETAKDGGISGQEIGDSIGTLVAEQNRNRGGLGTPSNIDDLERALANRTFESGGSFVSMAYLGDEDTGSRIAQESVEDFRDDDDNSTWAPIRNGNSGDIGRFNITIHADQGTDGNLTVRVGGPTSPTRTIHVAVDTDATEVSMTVAGGPTCNDIPASSDGTVRIDLYHGRVYEDGSCQFDLFPSSNSQHWIEFSGDTDALRGSYSIVTNASIADDARYDDTSGPEVEDAIWTFAYEFTYDTTAATVESDRREVEVYD